MRKKTNSSIYHIENYIQMQKVNCILKIRFISDEVNPQAKKIKILQYDRNKMGH